VRALRAVLIDDIEHHELGLETMLLGQDDSSPGYARAPRFTPPFHAASTSAWPGGAFTGAARGPRQATPSTTRMSRSTLPVPSTFSASV
jgi:hypothetical protein